MKCAICTGRSEVINSRPTSDGAAIYRRRRCSSCGARFSTYERPSESSGKKRRERIALAVCGALANFRGNAAEALSLTVRTLREMGI